MKKEDKDKYSDLFRKKINETWQSNTQPDYIIHVGKTNSGKTYNSVKRLKESGNGIYLAPLRLLAWEIADRLNNEGIPCSLITGEEQVLQEGAGVTSSTIEMANYDQEYEVAIIDEAFMIGDKDRGKSWLNAILNIRAKEIHVITNEEAFGLITKILDITGRGYTVKKYEMLKKFRFTDTNFGQITQIPKRGIFVCFSRLNVLIRKMYLEKKGHNVSVLYGNLPPEVKKKQITDFIEGRTDMVVTTDVIGMGINVPCDYIVFTEISKFDGVQKRRLNPLEIKQIAGRTGRYGLSSDDAFCSAYSSHDLNYLKTAYDTPYFVQKAYFGLTFEIFSAFPEKTPIHERLHYFKEIDFIPDDLKGIVFKEDISKYAELVFAADKKTFDLKTKWIFLTSPVKQNNKSYFLIAAQHYSEHKILKIPNVFFDHVDAKQMEDSISEIELYISLTMHLTFDPLEREKMAKQKEYLTDTLTTILMDKKLSTKKKCKICSYMLDITSPYHYCDECYENKIMSGRSSRGYEWD